jgi:CRP/FNR family transcriptional regulator, cyclic AMP receptor protein
VIGQNNDNLMWRGSPNSRAQDSRAAKAARSRFTPHHQARLPISQDEIGRMAGLSRQNANRALHDFEQTGLVRTRYGAIEVLDLEGRHAYSR